MSKEIPYQLSVNQLKDALDHVMRLAKASRSQTKRLKVIAARAEMALNGEVYEGKDLKLPKEARSPMSYENELRVTKRDLAAALEREQVLAAELADMRNIWLSIDDCEQGSHEQEVLISQMFTLIRDSHNDTSQCLARIKDKAQYDLIDGLLLNHTQFIPESAGPIVELLVQIQEGLRPQAEGAQREEDAAA
ncbi:hypothetical protein [Vreelandella alkaliphila]|uniref:hypothetical protein n=1 Tax=Vreelandella alkaliphila TaxID=272774 RepID=UPI003FD84E70